MSNALISDCTLFRYWLTRDALTAGRLLPPALFVMLNPSIADALVDDPTIRRCRNFADDWGHNGIVVANLYAFRTPKPADLWKAKDQVGPDNDRWLSELLEQHETVVCAWGAEAKQSRADQFIALAQAKGRTLRCLGKTLTGQPRHPLYVKGDTPLTPL